MRTFALQLGKHFFKLLAFFRKLAALGVQDPRLRPAEKREAADRAHAKYRDKLSDFKTWLHLWRELERRQEEEGSNNRFARWCRENFLSYLRVREWRNLQRFASLGEGNGPVDALDHALRAALSPIYPEIEEFELADYKVRILDAQHGTDSAIRVLVDTNCENLTWSTVGVGTDIIEASWEALTDALIVGLLRRGIQPR